MQTVELERVLSKVPLEEGVLKYVPLNKLPVGTVLTFTTKDPTPPTEPDQIREVNGKPEELVTYLPAGKYFLRVEEWGVVRFGQSGEQALKVKPLFDRLAVTSTFTANQDQDYVTYRLQTGLIKQIKVGNRVLRMEEAEQSTKSTQRMHRSPRSRKPRGQYKPLRNRRFS